MSEQKAYITRKEIASALECHITHVGKMFKDGRLDLPVIYINGYNGKKISIYSRMIFDEIKGNLLVKKPPARAKTEVKEKINFTDILSGKFDRDEIKKRHQYKMLVSKQTKPITYRERVKCDCI